MSKLNGKQNHPVGRRVVAGLCMFALSAAPACRGGAGGEEPNEPLAGAAADGFSNGPPTPGGAGIPTEPDPDLYVDPSSPVGTLPGALTVHPNGEARFGIPLDIPEGRGGLQPALSIEYASSAGTRESGKGWSIGGLSSITRCPGQIPADYQEMQPFFPGGGASEIFRDSLEPDPYHTLCLDGRLLYPLRAAYTPGQPLLLGVVGTPRMRVTADFPNGLNDDGSFTVDLPDGTSKTYGAWDSDDRVFAGQPGGAGSNEFYIRRWPLIEHAERSGNTVAYRYTSALSNTDVGTVTIDHRLSQVEYVGGTVDFTYSEEPIDGDVQARDRQVSYWRGARGEDSTYLTTIEVNGAAGGLRGEYRLGYARSEATGDLLLDAVSYCDREGVCMPATRFGYTPWEEESTSFTPSGGGGPALRLSPAEQESLLVADVNGDGLPDLVFDQEAGPSGEVAGIAVAYATQSGAYTDPYETGLDDVLGGMRAIDENGDGAVEIVFPQVPSGYPLTFESVDLRDPDSSTFGQLSTIAEPGEAGTFPGLTVLTNNCNQQQWLELPAPEWHCYRNHVYDYLAVDLEPGGEKEVLGCIRPINDWGPDTLSNPDAFWHDLRQIDPADDLALNGPGSSFYYPAGVACASDCEGGVCGQSRAFQLLDVNGDGHQEFLIGGLGPNSGFDTTEGAPLSDDSYHVFGYGFSQAMQPVAGDRLPLDVFQRANEANFGGPSRDILADVNGDGLLDALRFEPWETGSGSADDTSHWGDHFEEACDEEAILPPFDARLSVFVSRGDGTFVRQGSFDVFGAWSDYCDRFKQAVVADIDGDRVDEVYFPNPSTGFSDIARFYDGGATAQWETGPYLGGINATLEEYRPRPLDLTGTVKSGILSLSEDGGAEPYLNSDARAGFVDVLQTVTDGFGAQTELEYGSLSDGETFQGTACPSNHEALAPLRPLVAAVRRSIDNTSGIEVRGVSLHRYRGACHDAPNYNFRTFERHEVSEGFDFAGSETREITRRTVRVYDDYSTRFEREIFRARPSEVHQYEWFPEADRYRYSVQTGTFDYGEGFFDRASAPDWLGSVPVGVLIEDDSASTAQEFPGNCDLDPDFSSIEGWCESTGSGEFISDSAVVRSNRESFGLPRRVERRWGDQCSVETIGYEYREHTALRQHTIMQLGKMVSTGGGDGALGGVCDVSSPELAPQRAELVLTRDPTTWRVEGIVSQPGVPSQELQADLVYESGQLTHLTQTAPGSPGAEGALTNVREWEWTYDAT